MMKNIKKFLDERGIKQVDLVRQLNVDPARISMQVNGVRDLPKKYQAKLAEILNISVEELELGRVLKSTVGVGMPITEHPLHGSVRALLMHTALTSGQTRSLCDG